MIPAPLVAAVVRVFSLDLRSVALFRVGLAVSVLADLFWRSFDLRAFYTDAGVLPLHALNAVQGSGLWSVHALSGSAVLQIGLFVLTALAAVLLLVGYRSVIAAGVCWALMLSLHHRNPLLLQGGDDLLVILLFFAMLLPIGARFSLDAALTTAHRREPNAPTLGSAHTWFSVISVAATLQVLYLYVFTALLKEGSNWHADGDAAWLAVQLEDFARTPGVWLRDWPGLLTFGTHYVWWVELLAPLLVLCPLWHNSVRLIGLALLLSLHLSFAAFLSIGLFPLFDFVALSLLLPRGFWDGLRRTAGASRRAAVVMWYDGDCEFCLKMCLSLRTFFLPASVPILKTRSREDIEAVMQRENTWVLTDADGRLYRHGSALRLLLRLNPISRPLAWLLDGAWCARQLDRLYRWVATNRDAMGRVTAAVFPWREQWIRPALSAEIAGAMLLLAITWHNLTGLPAYQLRAVHTLDDSLAALGLNQRWDMFAPRPRGYSERAEFVGIRRSGEQVDAWHAEMAAPSLAFDAERYRDFDGNRWRKYLERALSSSAEPVQVALSRYACERWSQQYPDPLASVSVYRVRSFSPSIEGTRGRRDTSEQRWSHACEL